MGKKQQGNEEHYQDISDFITGSLIYYTHWGVSLNGGTPKTPKMLIFSRKTNGCWVPAY